MTTSIKGKQPSQSLQPTKAQQYAALWNARRTVQAETLSPTAKGR